MMQKFLMRRFFIRQFPLLLCLLLTMVACAPRTLQRSLRNISNAARDLPQSIRTVTGEERDRAVNGLTLGGTVILREGAYILDSSLIIEADLRLVGTGLNKSFLVLRQDATNDAMLRFRAERLIISGVSIVYQGARPAHVLEVEQGTIAIDHSRFMGGIRRNVVIGAGETGSGLVLSGSARGAVSNSIFVANQQHGIALEGGATFIIHQNFALRNGINGMRLRGDSDAEISNNSIRNNGGSGINFFEFARGQAFNNYSDLNGFFGIRMQGEARPQISQNVVRGNGIGSIAYYDKSGGSIRNNICDSNYLFVATNATPQIGDNACYTVPLQAIQNLNLRQR